MHVYSIKDMNFSTRCPCAVAKSSPVWVLVTVFRQADISTVKRFLRNFTTLKQEVSGKGETDFRPRNGHIECLCQMPRFLPEPA